MSETPGRNGIILENIPDELKTLDDWVCWVWKKRNEKLTKPPIDAKTTGQYASSTKPETWASYEKALRAYLGNSKIHGLGFVLSEGNDIAGVDMDNCRDPVTGELAPWAQAIVDDLSSYTEISPSKKGVKVFVKASLPEGAPAGGVKDDKIGLELYDKSRYFCVTGNRFDGLPTTIEPRQQQFEKIYEKYFGRSQNNNGSRPAHDTKPQEDAFQWDGNIDHLPIKAGTKLLIVNGAPVGERSNAIMTVLNSLVWSNLTDSQIFRVFEEYPIGEKWRTEHKSKQAWLQKQIEKARGRVTDRAEPPNKARGEKQPHLRTVPPDGTDEPKHQPRDSYSTDFPSSVMSGVAGGFAELFSSYTEAPAQFYYFSFLTCLGNILADRISLKSQISPQPRLYTLILGESSDDRKSTALSQTVKFFTSFMSHDSLNISFGVGSAEGLQKRLEKSNKLILVLDELKSFVGKCKIESSVLLPCVNTLFENNRYSNSTKSSDIQIDNAYLSILAASTVATYQNTWTSVFTDIGFNNRLFLVTGRGEPRFSIPPQIPLNELNSLRYDLQNVLQKATEVSEIEVDPEAFAFYDQWYLNRTQSVHSKRLDTYSHRLMILLTVNDGKNVVDIETVTKATQLCDWQLEVRRLNDPIDADNLLARMEEQIRRVLQGRGSAKDWELKRAVNSRRTGTWVYETAKNNLLKAREISFDNHTKEYVHGTLKIFSSKFSSTKNRG